MIDHLTYYYTRGTEPFRSLSALSEKGLPEEDWETNLPDYLAPYIEAQVWNHALLERYKPQVSYTHVNQERRVSDEHCNRL